MKSADDNKPTTTDEEDIMTILEDMKEPLMYSRTPKGDLFDSFSVANNFVIS